MRNMRSITITVAASEANLQRLAAYMLFCEHLEPLVEIGPEKPLPWEDPNDPRFVGERQIVDFAVVRREITKLLGEYVAAHSVDDAKALLKSFGGERLSDIPEPQLLGLHAALTPPSPPRSKPWI